MNKRLLRTAPACTTLRMLVIAACLLGNAAAQQPAPPGSASHPIEAAPMPLTEDEALPPVGKGSMLSDEQVRYCLAQLIRVDAVRPLLNRYEREEVEQFNALVADFNARCGSYRYKATALDEANAWLEDNRAQIEAAARESYMKRFPREPKAAKSPKKVTGAPPQSNSEPAVSARAVGEPAQSTVKPVAPPDTKPATSEPPVSKPKESASTAAKPVAPQAPRVASEDKPAQSTSKPVPAPDSKAVASEPTSAKPKESAAETSKPVAPPVSPPRASREEKPPLTAGKPASPTTAKPKDVAPAAGERSTRPSNAPPSVTQPQTASAAADTQTAATAKAVPVEPLISKPKESPAAGPDTSPATTAPAQAADTNAGVSAPRSESRPASGDDKAAKAGGKPPAVAAATTQAEPSAKPQTEERDTAPRPGTAHKGAKPANKPPRQLPSAARKTEPPAQVAAVASKPEIPAGPEAALARLTKEIQRAGSQVLPQPAGASDGNADLTTQVEVRYAAGGWVRSIVVGETSGSPVLDEQALALARATRFPDVPEELRAREFSVRFPVVFRAAR